MSILLFGANGQVGQACKDAFDKNGLTYTAVDRRHADLTKDEQIKKIILEKKPSVVVNAAAYTAVDKAESDSHTAHLVNAVAPSTMAITCAQLNTPFIHLSTDYIFDGSKRTPYTEDDPANPLTVYGKSKLEGEQGIRNQHQKHIIFRTSWVFANHGSNFVKTMLNLAQKKDVLNIVSDQVGNPTFAGDIAEVITKLIGKIHNSPEFDMWGTYHLAGTGTVSWFEFAESIFDESLKYGATKPVLQAISTAEYPTPALRPAMSSLNCQKLEKILHEKLPSWKNGMKTVVKNTINSISS